jgi:hypothetical protein
MDPELQGAIQEVLNLCPDGYAKAYAEAARGMDGHELYVQLLYIRANTSNWRGVDARRVKVVLDKYIRILK